MATQEHINELVNNTVNSYSGQFVAYHGGFPGQCTSPVKYFVESVIGKTAPYMANDRADGWGTNFPGELAPFFTHEVFQAGKAYPRGTILTWNSPHIAMVLAHDGSNTVTVFEQNADPEGSPCKTASRIINNQWHTANYAFVPIIDAPVPVAPAILVTPFATPQQFSHSGNFWNLDEPNFDAIVAHPWTDTNPNPITITAYLTRSDLPQYVYYLPDASVHHGYNKLDCTVYTPPVVNPAPSVINTPNITVPQAEKYTVLVPMDGFKTASDANHQLNYYQPVAPGSYFVYGDKTIGMINISTDNMKPGVWINPKFNEVPEPVTPTLPVDPPKVVTEPVNVNPAPIVDIAPAKKDIPWNWLNADHSPTVYRYKGTMPVPIRDLEGTKPPLTMNAGLQGPISRFTEIQGRTYLIPDSEFKKGNAYGIPQQLMAPIHQNILQEAEGDVLKFWESFEDLPKKVYTLISDISPVKRHEVIYKGRQFIDGFKKGSKK